MAPLALAETPALNDLAASSAGMAASAPTALPGGEPPDSLPTSSARRRYRPPHPIPRSRGASLRRPPTPQASRRAASRSACAIFASFAVRSRAPAGRSTRSASGRFRREEMCLTALAREHVEATSLIRDLTTPVATLVQLGSAPIGGVEAPSRRTWIVRSK